MKCNVENIQFKIIYIFTIRATMKILLIDDNQELIAQLSTYFNSSKKNITFCSNIDDAYDLIFEEYFDCFIINDKLNGTSTKEILSYIRDKDQHVPLILIFNYATTAITLEQFNLIEKYNCDDCIVKPFLPIELEIRIDNIFRKRRRKIIEINKNIYYDLFYEELYVNCQYVKLRKKEKRFLTLLLQNINQNVNINSIYNYVWEGEIKESYPLRQLVSDIRKVMNSDKNHIIPITGNGYRFEV